MRFDRDPEALLVGNPSCGLPCILGSERELSSDDNSLVFSEVAFRLALDTHEQLGVGVQGQLSLRHSQVVYDPLKELVPQRSITHA